MLYPKTQVTVCGFKYNGWMYRSVCRPFVLMRTKQIICLYLPPQMVRSIKNKKGTKRFCSSRNATSILWFFFKDQWFNVMISTKDKKTNFYVNLASPYIVEKGIIKYIDFDLDFKISDTKEFKILDKYEYLDNLRSWNYPPSIKLKIRNTVIQVVNLVNKNWFNKLMNERKKHYIKKYLKHYFSPIEYLKYYWKDG